VSSRLLTDVREEECPEREIEEEKNYSVKGSEKCSVTNKIWGNKQQEIAVGEYY